MNTQIKTEKLEDIIAKSTYYHVNSDLTTANFPQPEKIETENWKIITIDKTMSLEEVLAKIKAEGCRPANGYELAIWANNHREEVPKGKWYVALGQLWLDSCGSHGVPYLGASLGGGFFFGLGAFESVWSGDDVFFCFCDPSLSSGTLELEKSSDSLTLSPDLEKAIELVKTAGYKVIKEFNHTPMKDETKIEKKLYPLLAQFAESITDREGELTCRIDSEEFAMKADDILSILHTREQEIWKEAVGIVGEDEEPLSDHIEGRNQARQRIRTALQAKIDK